MTDFLKLEKAFPGGSVTVKIMGFGRAHRINKDPNLLGAVPKIIRPPELYFTNCAMTESALLGAKRPTFGLSDVRRDTDTLAPALYDRVKV
ncbi:hypothetical protein E4U58_001431 [Claviceps cyperi]|nr:hypothetical protein E4U58_001431 [Claviceps cyperi]